MSMNVKPVPALDDEVNEIRLGTAEIVNQNILPFEDKLWGWLSDSANASNQVVEEAKELRHEIQNKVKGAKLWAPHLPTEFGGMHGLRRSRPPRCHSWSARDRRRPNSRTRRPGQGRRKRTGGRPTRGRS